MAKKYRAMMKRQAKTFEDVAKKVNANTSKPVLKENDFEEKIEVIPEYKLVKKLIDEKFPLIFVTGGAGTGKSTFINWLYTQFASKIILTAPTGVAALTISGKTIHSLCKFPPAWIVPEDIKIDPKSTVSKAKILVIDEISMVNANLLDSMDSFLRLNTKKEQPFGGLTVVMVGDLFQLPPVVTSTTKSLFAQEYSTPNFFAAKSLSGVPFVKIELEKAFRQKDQKFVDLLANIREGINVEETISEINKVCTVSDVPPKGSVALAPRLVDVERINKNALAKLPDPIKIYEGETRGEFKEKLFPAPKYVELKKGAQVVLLNNTKDWVNGSVGIVEEMYDEKIVVELVDTGKKVEVVKYIWKQYDYVYNKDADRIERAEIGAYQQIPAILSWAMTIHKSQGLTLDRVHLDLGGGAFEYGQTYVALSRCRELSKLSLTRPINVSDIKVDPETREFYKQIRETSDD